MQFSKHKLDNGLRVIFVPMKSNPTVTFSVFVEAGSNYEEKHENGLSHFLEHMCFNGTKNRPTPQEVVLDLDNIGAIYNAFTDYEFTGYFAKVGKEQIDKAFDVVSDIYLNSIFPEETLKNEKGVVIEEINLYNDLPQSRVWDRFVRLLYGDTPAGRDILGSKENIESFNVEMIKKYRGALYSASSTIIVVSGDFDEEYILEKIKKTFVGFLDKPTRGKEKVIETQTKPEIFIENKKTEQTHFVLGVRAFGANDSQTIILKVLSGILGAGLSSRLFTKMRTDLGICYYVRASIESFTNRGIFSVSSGVNPGRLNEAIVAVLGEFRKLKTELVPEKELEKVKNSLIGSLELSLETSDSNGYFVAGQEILKGEIKKPEEIAEGIKKVSAEEIKDLANKIFVNEKLNLAIIGSGIDEEEMKKLLRV